MTNSQLPPQASFIGKEKDNESYLDDFGVRKYDDGIGRFTSIDPLWEKYYSWSPYQYCANNPVMFLDANGMYIDANGDRVDEGIAQMNSELSFVITRDSKTGRLSIPSGTVGKNDAEKKLIKAITDNNVILELDFTKNHTMNDVNGNLQQVNAGMYGGSKVNSDGTITSIQGINLDNTEKFAKVTVDNVGQNIIHETLEGYICGEMYPGTTYPSSYTKSHNETMRLYPLSGNPVITASQDPSTKAVSFFVNGSKGTEFLYTLPLSTMQILQNNSNK